MKRANCLYFKLYKYAEPSDFLYLWGSKFFRLGIEKALVEDPFDTADFLLYMGWFNQ